MLNLAIPNRKQELTIINASSEKVQVTSTSLIEPYEVKTIPIQDRKVSFLNQVDFPSIFNQNVFYIVYQSVKGYAIMPVSVPTYIHKFHSLFQIINLSKRKEPIGIRAKYGDHFGQLAFQQKHKLIEIHPSAHLVMEYYKDKEIWETVEVEEMKQGTYLLHVIIDDGQHKTIQLEISLSL